MTHAEISPASQRLCITHVASGDLWAGAEMQCFQLLRSLAEAGELDVNAVILNAGELAERLAAVGIDVTVLPETRHSARALYRELVKLLRARRPDVVHTHRTKENILGAFAARRAGVPVSIRTSHGAAEHGARGLALRQRLLGAADDFVGRRIQDHVVAVSTDLGGRLRAQFGASHVSTIANGIDVARTVAEAGAPILLPGRSGRLRVGFIGRLAPVKRLDVFLQVASALHAALPDQIEFYVVGDGPQAALAQVAAQLGSPPLHFLGFRRDALALLRQLDVLLMTSDHEGTPMVVLEALCLRVLVAAHRVGGLPALLGEGQHGLLVPSQEPAAWVDALRPLLLDAGRRRALTDAGFESVNSQWSARANASAYARLYRQCLAASNKRPRSAPETG